MHTIKIQSASFLFLALGIFMFFFVVVPTPAAAGIIVCGDCCQPPYEASGVYGDGPSGGSCYSTGNSWDYCEECVTRNSWGVCTAYEVYQGQASSPGCGGCAGVRCEYPAPTTYRLTTSVSPAGSGTISPSSRDYNSGTNVTVTKSANTGYIFDYWSGGSCSGTGTSCSVSMTANRTVTANFKLQPTAPTITGTLTASPTSGLINSTFTYTATRTGGTATGTVTYTNPVCTNGTLVSGSYSGSTDRTFQCRYATPSNGWLDRRGASMRINQGSAFVNVSSTVDVTGSSFYISLAGSPLSGNVNTTTFYFTPAAYNVPPPQLFSSYSLTYNNPQCGSGGSISSFNSLAGTFRCTYSTAGTKTASVAATATRTFSPTLTDSDSVSVNVAVPTPAVSVSLSASPSSITRGESSQLTWSSSNASTCTPTNFSTGGAFSGSTNVSPTANTTYSLTCSNAAGSLTRSALVNVQSPPPLSVSLNANPATITRGNSSILSWSSVNANSCTSTNFSLGGSMFSGTTTLTPTGDTTYSFRCTNLGGSLTRSAIVRVQEPAISAVNAWVNPTWVSRGGSTVAGWEILPSDAGDTATCTVARTDPGVVLSPSTPRNYFSNQRSVTASNIQQATRLTVTCTNNTNTRSGEATVYVLPSYSEF